MMNCYMNLKYGEMYYAALNMIQQRIASAEEITEEQVKELGCLGNPHYNMLVLGENIIPVLKKLQIFESFQKKLESHDTPHLVVTIQETNYDIPVIKD